MINWASPWGLHVKFTLLYWTSEKPRGKVSTYIIKVYRSFKFIIWRLGGWQSISKPENIPHILAAIVWPSRFPNHGWSAHDWDSRTTHHWHWDGCNGRHQTAPYVSPGPLVWRCYEPTRWESPAQQNDFQWSERRGQTMMAGWPSWMVW